MTLRVAVVGHGRTGSEVATLVRERGHEAVPVGKGEPFPTGCHVGIDFTRAEAVLPNLEAALARGARYVVGTTGFDVEAARQRVVAARGGCVHAPNFSLGVNLFYRVVREATRLVGPFAQYDPYVLERHHRGKLDAPSGTARALGRILESGLPGRTPADSLPLREGAFHTASLRAGGIVGDHIVGFASPEDEILLEHRSRSRRSFAVGAVLSAEWIAERTGFYSFDEVLAALGTP